MANEVAAQPKSSIASYLTNDKVRENIEKVVGTANMQSFVSSIVSAVQTNPELAKCSNSSIMSVGLLMQSLKLPPSPQLGYAYFVPYKNKAGGFDATFQMSAKGMIQLAQRSGQYRKLNVSDVREGEIKKFNPILDDYEFEPIQDPGQREQAKIIGYYGYFEMINGFKKGLYMSIEQLLNHAKKYSVSYRSDLKYGNNKSLWSGDTQGMMCEKTVIKRLLSKYGVMSVEMEHGFVNDQAVVSDNGPVYVDSQPDEPEPAVDVYETVTTEESLEDEMPFADVEGVIDGNSDNSNKKDK